MEIPEKKPENNTDAPRLTESFTALGDNDSETPDRDSDSASPQQDSEFEQIANQSNGQDNNRPASSVLLDFQPQHRQVLRIATGILLAALVLEWILIAVQRPKPLTLQRGEAFHRQFRIEINSATWIEWLQMEGIGQSLAHRIVADRKLNGPFRTIDDVARVPGIGPTTLDRIRPWLTIRHDLIETQPLQSAAFPESQQPGEERSADRARAHSSQGKPITNDRKSATF